MRTDEKTSSGNSQIEVSLATNAAFGTLSMMAGRPVRNRVLRVSSSDLPKAPRGRRRHRLARCAGEPVPGSERSPTRGGGGTDDLHLHRACQRRVVADLRRTFPNLQFVATTRSPLVVSSVAAASLWLLTPEGGIDG